MFKKTFIITLLIIFSIISNSFSTNIDDQKLRYESIGQHDLNKNGILDLGDVIIVLQIMSGMHISHISQEKGIIFDGSMNSSTAEMKLEGDIEITSDYGRVSGENLFHSFHTFNIQANEEVNFSGPNTVKNIIIRVTGDEKSFIDGQFRSNIPNANIFLLNPCGVMIGENASIDVNESFHISTADYLVMNNAEPFIVNTENDELSFSEPTAFGILDINSGKIEITNSIIQMEPGITISVIGSEVIIKNSKINCYEGRINIASLSSCEISLVDNGLTINGEYTPGNISILDDSEVESDDIYIWGGDVQFNNESILETFVWDSAGIISIQVKNLNVSNGSSIHSRCDFFEANNTGSDVIINATETVHFSNGSSIGVNCISSFGASNNSCGDVLINATETVHFSNDSSLSMLSDIDTGDIVIHSTDVLIKDGAYIASSTNFEGDSGEIQIEGNSLTIQGSTPVEFNENYTKTDGINFSGIYSYSGSQEASEKAGAKIIINTLEVSLSDEGTIKTSSTGKRDAGDIFLNVKNLQMDNKSSIRSESLALVDGGAAGKICLTANNDISIKNNSLLSTEAINTVSTDQSLDNGKIEIKTKESIYVINGKITTSVLGSAGAGGNIDIRSELLVINHSNIFANAYEGNGGNIHIVSENIVRSEDSKIEASSELGIETAL